MRFTLIRSCTIHTGISTTTRPSHPSIDPTHLHVTARMSPLPLIHSRANKGKTKNSHCPQPLAVQLFRLSYYIITASWQLFPPSFRRMHLSKTQAYSCRRNVLPKANARSLKLSEQSDSHKRCCNEGGGSIKKWSKARNALFRTRGL